jgi:hypothetical protein
MTPIESSWTCSFVTRKNISLLLGARRFRRFLKTGKIPSEQVEEHRTIKGKQRKRDNFAASRQYDGHCINKLGFK